MKYTQNENKIRVNNASQGMMSPYTRVPHSSVIYKGMELRAANASLKVCWELSNYGSIIYTQGRWLLIAPYEITYPWTVNVAIAILRR